MGIPILAGRGLGEHDRRLIVVSASLAERLWPNESPLGRQCLAEWGELKLSQVIGVAGEVHTRLDRPPLYMVYVPDSWATTPPGAPGSASIVVRTSGDPASIAQAVRNVIHETDRDVPIVALRPMSQLVAVSLENRRFQIWLTASFAGSALLLAALGIFGVLAYSVEQRRREFGIRTALGAPRRQLFAMIMRQGLRPVVLGVVVGLMAAASGGRLLESLLFGISPLDAVTFLLVTVLIISLAVVACYIPARRTVGAEVMAALRYE